jgi:hypothetical protein
LPLPRRTSPRSSGLAPSASRAVCTPPIRSSLQALFTSGRFRVTVATPRESRFQTFHAWTPQGDGRHERARKLCAQSEDIEI